MRNSHLVEAVPIATPSLETTNSLRITKFLVEAPLESHQKLNALITFIPLLSTTKHSFKRGTAADLFKLLLLFQQSKNFRDSFHTAELSLSRAHSGNSFHLINSVEI